MSRHLTLASLTAIGSVLQIFAAAPVVVVPDEATAVERFAAAEKEGEAFASLFNPLDEPIRRRVVLPLYYAGLSGKAEISVGDDAAFVPVALDARCRAEVEVSIPANGNSSR